MITFAALREEIEAAVSGLLAEYGHTPHGRDRA